MTDVIDLACEREEQFRDDALDAFHAHQRPSGESAANCKSCGDPIPEERRRAVTTNHCVDCAGQMERAR